MKRLSQKLPLAGIAIAALMAGTITTTTAEDTTGYQVDRQTMMAQVGAATRILAGMARGEAPYEAGAATNGLRVYQAVSAAWPYMFPEGTETGNETEAAPTIWSDRNGFIAAANKFEADTAAALETAGDGLEAFQAAFGAAAANCRACHEDYRISRE